MRVRRLWVLLLLSLLALSACAGSPGQERSLDEKLAQKGYALGNPVKSIRDWRLNGWTYVDERNFIMHSGVSDRYLVTLRTSSFDLRGAVNIAFSTTAGSLTDKDKVIVRLPGDFRETYLIDALHELRRVERTEAG